MKKFISALLAAVLCAAVSLPVFAETNMTPDEMEQAAIQREFDRMVPSEQKIFLERQDAEAEFLEKHQDMPEEKRRIRLFELYHKYERKAAISEQIAKEYNQIAMADTPENREAAAAFAREMLDQNEALGYPIGNDPDMAEWTLSKPLAMVNLPRLIMEYGYSMDAKTLASHVAGWIFAVYDAEGNPEGVLQINADTRQEPQYYLKLHADALYQIDEAAILNLAEIAEQQVPTYLIDDIYPDRHSFLAIENGEIAVYDTLISGVDPKIYFQAAFLEHIRDVNKIKISEEVPTGKTTPLSAPYMSRERTRVYGLQAGAMVLILVSLVVGRYFVNAYYKKRAQGSCR